MAGWSASGVQKDPGEYGSSLRPKLPPSLTGLQLAKQTYTLCRERFEEFLPLILGAAILGYGVCRGLEYLNHPVRPEVGHSVFDPPSIHLPPIFLQRLLRCLEVLAAWGVITLTFASVAVKILYEVKGVGEQKLAASAAVRLALTQNLRGLAGVTLLGAASTMFCSASLTPVLVRPLLGLLISLHQFENYSPVVAVARGVVFIIFGIPLTMIAPAIAGLMDKPGKKLREAVEDGMKSTQGRRGFLFGWLGSTTALGALVYYVTTDILHDACLHGDIQAAACPLFTPFLAVILLTVVAGPALIWFSLSYTSLHYSHTKRLSPYAPAGEPPAPAHGDEPL